MSEDFTQLPTERPNAKTSHISTLPTREALLLINDEDQGVAPAVREFVGVIADAVDQIALRLKRGGRLIYIGAGTSGRVGVLDASECPPTFGTSPGLVQGLIAGGREAMFRSQEGAEDDTSAGAAALNDLDLGPTDCVVGIAASGRTPYVLGALSRAREVGALTVGLTVNHAATMAPLCDYFIAPEVGPEVITGSTRMKAGTAQKLVLNMISTGAMLKLGLVSGNRMTNLQPLCQKLVDRAIRLVMDSAGVDAVAASEALERAGGNAAKAIELLDG